MEAGQRDPSPPPAPLLGAARDGGANPGKLEDPVVDAPHTATATTGTTPVPTVGASTSTSVPLLDKIMSRVKLLGRSRHVPLRAARSGLPESKTKSAGLEAGQDALGAERLTASRRAASEMATTARASKEEVESDSISVLSTASSGCTFTDSHENGGRRFRVKDLAPFCEQLDRLLDYIHSTADLNNIIYTYPSKLQNLLDTQANELRTIYREAQAARIRIQQVKNQRKAVRKECKALGKAFASIKEEEIKEMENYIACYDKSFMTRWEKIRSSTQEDVVDSFIHDIKGKQKALDYLHTLATNKLSQMQSHGKKSSASEDSKPVSFALRRLSAGSGARVSTGRWRNKHHERAIRAPSSTTAPDANSSMNLVPLATAPFSLTLAPRFTGSTSSEGSSRISSPSTFGSASSSLIPSCAPAVNGETATNIVTSPPTPSTPERRSVLQALFSDIQHPGTHDNLPINAVMPRLVGASSTAARTSGQSGPESQHANSTNNNDIELYNVQDQP